MTDGALSYLLPLVVVFAVSVLLAFNSLVRARNRVLQTRSRIAVELRRRADLLPNLVAAVRGYMAHESATLEAVTRARTEEETDAAARGLLARIEAYPQIRADVHARDLMEQLVSTENRLAFARDQALEFERRYRDRIGLFPLNLVAKVFGFVEMTPDRLSGGEMAAAPHVELS